MRPGDSLWSISHKFHADWYNLAADNGMQMYGLLYPDKVLVLPRPGEPPHPPMPLTALEAAPSQPPAQSTYQAPAESTYQAPAESTYQAPAQSTYQAPAQPTYQAPTPSASATSGGSAFRQCVIARESGGNPNVMNGSGHWGLFQFSASTWAAYGGNPGSFGSASAGEQQQVFSNAMARGGQSNWAPYDGC